MKLEELITKYPKLFRSDFRFQCDDGWVLILDRLLNYIHYVLGRYQEVKEIQERLLSEGKDLAKDYAWIPEYFQSNPEDPLTTFEIQQIKEKFGGLRFYWNCKCSKEDWARIDGAVTMAQALAHYFCEVCGSNDGVETRTSANKHWIRTLCQKHRTEEEGSVANGPGN